MSKQYTTKELIDFAIAVQSRTLLEEMSERAAYLAGEAVRRYFMHDSELTEDELKDIGHTIEIEIRKEFNRCDICSGFE